MILLMLEVVTKKLYSDDMIIKEQPGNTLNSTEEFVLVPISSDTHDPTSGFYRTALDRFPLAKIRLGKRFLSEGPLEPGEVFIVEFAGLQTPSYALAFAGIHRVGEYGWRDAPENLAAALENIPARRLGRTSRIATAGIPGTGFSGLKGGADPTAIRAALDESSRHIVIYHDDLSGDREPRIVREPQPQLAEALPLPVQPYRI